MALISHVRKIDTWIIGSGCSYHMIGNKTKFEYLEHYDGGSVRFENNEPCYLKGKWRIALNDGLKFDNEENEKMTLISHVRKNDTCIIDSDYSHHMTGDKTKLF